MSDGLQRKLTDLYITEKVGTAMRRLVTSPAPIQQRLAWAWQSMHVLQPDDFSNPEHRALHEEIVAALSQDGTIRATLRAMSDQRAEQVANMICDLDFATRAESTEGR